MNPIYASDEQQLDFIGSGWKFCGWRANELYLNMRFLDVALSSLQFVPDGQIRPVGTDGVHLYFHPDALAELFRTGRVRWRGLSAQPAALPLRASVDPGRSPG